MRLNAVLGLLAGMQLLAGLLLQLLLLRLLGAGQETDAYIAAQAVPMALFAVLSVSLQSVWQPRLALACEDPVRWNQEQGLAQGQTFLCFGLPSALLWATGNLWIPIVFPGLSAAQIETVAELNGLLLLAGMLNGHVSLLVTAFRAQRRYLIGEIVSLFGYGVALGLIVSLVPVHGVAAAAWAMLGKALLAYAWLGGRSSRCRPDVRGGAGASNVWRQLRPLLLGGSLYKTSPLVDRFWSSQASAGSLTVFNLAHTAMGAVATIIEKAIATPVAPELARYVSQSRFDLLKYEYRKCLAKTTCLGLLFSVFLWALQSFLTRQASDWLLLSPQLAHKLWLICMLLTVYLVAAAGGTIVVNTFYALGNTRTPVLIGVVGFGCGVVLKSVGFLVYGLPGLAAATSAYYAANLLTLVFVLEKHVDANLSRQR